MNEEFIALHAQHEHVPTVCRLLINDYVKLGQRAELVYNSPLSELRVYGVPPDAPIMQFITLLGDGRYSECYGTNNLYNWMDASVEAGLEVETAVDLWYEFNPTGSWKMDLRRREEARARMTRSARKYVEGWAQTEMAEVRGK